MALELLALESAQLRLELLPQAGGRIHRLTAFGTETLRTPADLEEHVREPFFWGSYPLVPWSNRIPDGRLRFGGQTYEVGTNYGAFAIHGEAYAAPWSVVESGPLVRLAFEGGAKGRFPWRYRSEQTFELRGASLISEISLENLAGEPMPGGLGIHPWFNGEGGLKVEIPADLVYPSENQIPTGDPQPVGGECDLRRLREAPWGLDEVWTGLTRPRLAVQWPSGLGLDWTFSAHADHVVLAAFTDFRAVAIEPVTHATDGFSRLEAGQTGGVDVLAPGETLRVRYELEFKQG